MGGRLRIAGSVLVTLVLVLQLGGAASAQVVDRTTQLTSFSFSASSATLSGTAVRYLSVRLALSDPDGIPDVRASYADGPDIDCPCVFLQNTSKGGPRGWDYRALRLRLTEGTREDGVWTGLFAVGAADAGIWRATRLIAGDLWTDGTFGNEYRMPAPWSDRTLNVRGWNWPVIWLGTRVRQPSGVDLVRGGASLSATHAPVVNVRLEIRDSCSSVNHPSPAGAVRTDTAGRYAFSVAANDAFSFGVCTALAVYPTDAIDNLVVPSNTRQLEPIR